MNKTKQVTLKYYESTKKNVNDLQVIDSLDIKPFTVRDITNILVLAMIVLAIGLYLIATTIMISKDGVCYINYAKALAVSPCAIIKDSSAIAPSYTPGYPFLILLMHKFLSVFGCSSAVMGWVHAAQIVTLLCKLLSLISIYLLGKELIGRYNSFYATLVIILLPISARYGSDVLREWPYLVFLCTGLLFLFWAAKYKIQFYWFLAGLAAGMGSYVRPECTQLIVYGLCWIIYNLIKERSKAKENSLNAFISALSMISIFVLIIMPYIYIRGTLLPYLWQQMIESINSQANSFDNTINLAAIIPTVVIKGILKLLSSISENTMYYFLIPASLGLSYFYLAEKRNYCKFFITFFIFINVISPVVRFCLVGLTLSDRYTMPLTIVLMYFVPQGIEKIVVWLNKIRKIEESLKNDSKQLRIGFYTLLAICLALCMPKSLKPLNWDKKTYLYAAKWLKENTSKESIIAVPDPRIAFYAERQMLLVKGQFMSQDVDYTVKVHKSNQAPMLSLDYPVVQTFQPTSTSTLVIYKMAFAEKK